MCFFFQLYGYTRVLHVLTHSFPTRRSSDLAQEGGGIQARLDLGDREIAEVGFLAVEDIGVVSIGADRIDFPRRQQAREIYAVRADADRKSTRLHSSH